MRKLYDTLNSGDFPEGYFNDVIDFIVSLETKIENLEEEVEGLEESAKPCRSDVLTEIDRMGKNPSKNDFRGVDLEMAKLVPLFTDYSPPEIAKKLVAEVTTDPVKTFAFSILIFGLLRNPLGLDPNRAGAAEDRIIDNMLKSANLK